MKKFQTKFGAETCDVVCAILAGILLVLPAVAQEKAASDAIPEKPAAKKTTSSHHSTQSTSANSATAHHSSSSKKRSSKKKSARSRGQQKIDSERAQQIQEALIREHYLSGEASGTWNETSEAAMRKYQADHGWQSKTVPDSRALISLGLGPSKDHLLNPESAMTTVPDRPKGESMPTTSHSAPATSAPMPATATPSPAANSSSDPQ